MTRSVDGSPQSDSPNSTIEGFSPSSDKPHSTPTPAPTEARAPTPAAGPQKIDWPLYIPFLATNAACLSVFWVGWSTVAVGVCAVTLFARVFVLTAFYHRYFSHRAFKTSRVFQFIAAALGTSAMQRGPIWWAANHRHHHRHSDLATDMHSPHEHGFWYAHMAWFMTKPALNINTRLVKDWMKFPELRFLDRYFQIVPLALAAALYGLGALLQATYPQFGTTGMQMLIWGYLISTVLLYHITFSINSVAHRVGRRRFPTRDHSRNSLVLALATFGEGWHNNHHHYPASARQGFYWWEIDITYYLLVVLSWTGLIWDLRAVPVEVLEAGRALDAAKKTG